MEAIRFRMEQLGLDRRALQPCNGSRARGSEVLAYERRLTVEMNRRLNERLDIPADVLSAS